jgi:glutamate formiminotransferase/formiminotetrahydrofolate cyclodeaminase
MLVDMKLKEFLDELASSSPAPGGGSVSALLGALCSALTSMVCRLTEGKKGYENVTEDIRKVLEESEEIRKRTIKLIDEDTEVFNEVMSSFKTPKENLDRRKIIQDALKKATEVPIKTMKECYRVLELSKIIAEKGNVNSISDAGVAALVAHAGIQGAKLNVMINLKSLKDEEFKKKCLIESDEIVRKSEGLVKDVLKIVNEKIRTKIYLNLAVITCKTQKAKL